MNTPERRKYNRLPIKLDLSYRKVGAETEKSHIGHTVNVSPGGLYFETDTGEFEQGNLLKVELSIPPKAGLLEFGGRISGFAKVLRTHSIPELQQDTGLRSGGYGVALEFCKAPKLCT